MTRKQDDRVALLAEDYISVKVCEIGVAGPQGERDAILTGMVDDLAVYVEHVLPDGTVLRRDHLPHPDTVGGWLG